MRIWPQSAIARFALLVFVAIAASMAILLAFLSRTTQAQLDADARARINAETTAIVRAFETGGETAVRAVIAVELAIGSPLLLRFEPPPGGRAAGNLSRWPAGVGLDRKLARIEIARLPDTEPEPFAVSATALPGGYRLLVGRSLAEQERLTATLTTSLVAAIGLALVLATGISLLLTRLASRRIQAIADVASAVAAGDFSRRVAVPEGAPRDAFDSLGSVLNTMLARIESLLDELRALTDGLAHDLRAPLTRMKARIDRMQHSGDAGEAQLAGIGAEADALLAMLENSLAITRAEAGIGRDNFESTDLAALATRMAEMYEPLADEGGVALRVTAPAPVIINANRALLGRALANLIDNALRYAAGGASIAISVSETPEGACLAVADRGPGIPAADRETALRRFGRLDAARSASGAGLGLSLAAAIARLHGGTLDLAENGPGLKVTISLPRRLD